MRFFITSACLAVVLLQLAACETTALNLASARPVPPERIVQLPNAVTGSEASQITVTRDSGLYGSGLPILLSINKRDVARFRTEETLTLSLPPGEHLISVVANPSLGSSSREYEVNLKPGARTFYRISITQGGVVFQRTSETQ